MARIIGVQSSDPGAMSGVSGGSADVLDDVLDGQPLGAAAPKGEDTTLSLFEPSVQLNVDVAVPLNRDGTIKRKPGRKLGGRNAEKSPDEAPKLSSVARTPAQIKSLQLTNEQTARLLINNVVGVMVNAVGPEWDFSDDVEAKTTLLAVTAYLDAKGGIGMSPETMLLFAVGGYAIPRVKVANTREKFLSFFGTAWKTLRSIFGR